MALLALSCTAEPAGGPEPAGETRVAISCLSHAPGSKSSVGAAEDAINSITMLFYEDGHLLPSLTVSGAAGGGDGYRASLTLGIGQELDVVVFANCNVPQPPATLQEAKELRYSCDGVADWTDGLPMAGSRSISVRYGMPEVRIELTRLAARVDLSIDTSGLEHGSVTFTSVKVLQMNRVCPFFSSGAADAEGGTCDGDISSAEDLRGINASGTPYRASFYLLENLQGDILRGNSDPDSKIPDSVSAAGGDPALCTCLEIKGVYTDHSGYLTGEPLTARLFLGGNATSNFDVLRNVVYRIVLYINDKGCLRSDWKVESNVTDRRTLYFSRTSLAVSPSTTETVRLNTNLSLAAGDYTYTIVGNTEVFSVSTTESGFSVTAASAIPDGAGVVVTVSSWDGALSSTCRISSREPVSWIHCSWEGADGLYVGQRGVVTIDSPDGEPLDGRILLIPTGTLIDVYGYGDTWYVDALFGGNNLIDVSLDGYTAEMISVDVIPPTIAFASDNIILPLDGSEVECGPFYFRNDGTRLLYSDFAPDLYERMLAYDITRTCIGTMGGRYWPKGRDGNVAVELRVSEAGGDRVCYASLKALSYNKIKIENNYDLSSGPVQIETLDACTSNLTTGIWETSANLCIEDPFTESQSFGTFESRALTSWLRSSRHDESFEIPQVELTGCSPANLSVSEQGSGSHFRYSFLAGGSLMVTVPYDDEGVYAMPPAEVRISPAVTNSVSGEQYVSPRRYVLSFLVNIATGGIATPNGSGTYDISAGWSFPRQTDGVLASLENIVASGNASVRGMYTTLYSTSDITSAPQYSYIPPGAALASSSLLSVSSYSIPAASSGGYSLKVWKYNNIYSDSSGWLDR